MMRSLRQIMPIFLLLLLVVSMPVSAGEPKTEKSKDATWTVPLAIDVNDESAGDFLDANLDEFTKKAIEAYNMGEYEKAAKYYLTLLRYNIHDAVSIYNLACCYGLLGNDKLAAKYLERSIKAGFNDFEQINRDPDFDKVKAKPVFDDVLKNLKKITSEKEKELGKVVFVDSPAFFKCRIHLPDNYDPKKEYPLVVGLHGLGGNPERFMALWKKFGNPDFILALPQAPYPISAGTEMGYSWMTGGPEEEKIGQKSSELTENYISDVVVDLHKRFKIGDVYLLGFSQGCGFTYLAGIKHYELFKGLICFGGWLNPEWIGEDKIDKAKGLRVFIAHGKNDRVVEFENGTKARDYLKDHDYDVKFFEFDGGHEVPVDALKQVELWMKGK